VEAAVAARAVVAGGLDTEAAEAPPREAGTYILPSFSTWKKKYMFFQHTPRHTGIPFVRA